MSFKLFYLSTFKGLKNTQKVESAYDNLFNDYLEYVELENSDELKTFLETEQLVLSEAFKKQKTTLQKLKFKGSPEEKQLLEYRKLEKNKKLLNYYLVAKSPELKRFEELKNSDQVLRFLYLKEYVVNNFKADKASFKSQKKKDDSTRFEDTDAYKKFAEFNKLKESEDILFWLKYPKSSLYKNYLRMDNNAARHRFEELKDVVNSDEFKERKAYLEDDRKWEKTEEAKRESVYLDLKSQPRFVNYLKYRGTNAFDFYRNWELVFEDRFESGKLDLEKWQTISLTAQKTIGRNFSKAGDLQAYTDGNNIQLKNNQLQIVVKNEKTETMVWNFPGGFVPTMMDYSSGILTTGEKFLPTYGILEAKVRFQPNKNLVDVIYLSDPANEYRLNLLECGKVKRMGFESNMGISQHTSLSGLAPGQFYIFRLEWENGRVVWKINNQVIFETTQQVPVLPMNINLSSIVVESGDGMPHYFEIDWIRFFRKK